MSKENIEPALAQMLDSIAELEGVIACKREDGSVITGQNITELDLGAVAKKVIEIINLTNELGGTTKKGEANEMQFTFEEGFAQAVWNDAIALIALTGLDGRNAVGLVVRSLKQNLAKIG